MIFSASIPIRFAQCDPAGIVFYPRYFEMFNAMVEDWCEQGLEKSFREMHLESGVGLPTADVSCTFLKPTELGETLEGKLVVEKIGNRSLHIEIVLSGADGEQRVLAKLVLVLMDLKTRKAIPLPDSLREKMALYLRE